MVILLFQCACMLAALALAFVLPLRSNDPHRSLFRRIGRIARRRKLAVLLSGALGFAAAAALTVAGGKPNPEVHDEFSYLLGADTIAHGRLTNPTHPLWIHFETFHIIHQPTYASKYPPAQALLLALGQVAFGHPIVGVWLSMGLMSAAVCWMLQAWAPARWALLGGMLAATQTSMLLWWGYSYMGAGLALAGGALVFGALRRLLRRPQASAAALLAAGLVVLANSRPYEGMVVSLPAAVMLVPRVIGRTRWPVRTTLLRVVLPACAVLAPAGAAMAITNDRVTGHPLRFPYTVHEARYAIAPVFIFLKPYPTPEYHHEEMRRFYAGVAFDPYRKQQSFEGWARVVGKKAVLYYFMFYCQPIFILPLLLTPCILRDRLMRPVILTIGLMMLAVAIIVWTVTVYGSPAGGLFFLVVVQGMRRLRLCQCRGKPIGRFLTSSIIVISFLSLIPFLFLRFAEHAHSDPHKWSNQRARLVNQLDQMDGKHLVVVYYHSRHDTPEEWVYNQADIDGAKIVWARGMSPEQNEKLLEYFRGRHVWLLNPDDRPIHLEEMPAR